jgi:GTP-binding protein
VSTPAPLRPAALLATARFVTSVAESEQLQDAPLQMLPEVAAVGRSNAGKSSTINALAQRRQLAFASKTPGRTQLLNFFELSRATAPGERAAVGYLVDLPGYGFAKVDDATRQRWDMLVGGYLRDRRMLRGVLLIMDARHPLKPADEELLGWLAARDDPAALRLHLVLNKADQLKTMARRAALAQAELRAEALPMPTSVQLLSATEREGLDELGDAVVEMLGIKA